MKKSIVILWLLFVIFGCSNDENKLKVDVSKISSDTKIIRFEQVFYQAKPQDLSKIKKKFEFLFPKNVADSTWINKMNDKDEQELFNATQKAYPNLNDVKNELDNLFKHVKYYYPKFKEPKVITLNSNISLDQRTVYADSILFISLDVFLGKDNKIYESYPEYVKQNFTKKQLLVNSAKAIVQSITFPSNDRTFIARIIQEGKKIYAINALLPDYDKANLIGFSPEKLAWSEANEQMIWSYFVDKELLYNTDLTLNRRFIDDAPFSKFFLDIDNESPGRIGVWLGWQIVNSYMKHHPKVSLPELMKLDNETIFKQSKYKPRK